MAICQCCIRSLAYHRVQGAAIAYDLYSSYNQTVRATHLALLIFLPPTAEEIAEQNITLSEDEQVTERRTAAYFAFGQGYFQEHEFKARPQVLMSRFGF